MKTFNLKIRASDIALFRRSPYKYFHKTDIKETPNQAFGTLTHLRVLEPEKFESEIAIEPDYDFIKLQTKKTKKALKEEFETENKDKKIISLDHYNDVNQIYINLITDPLIKEYVNDKQKVTEETQYLNLIDETSNTPFTLQGTPDLYLPNKNIIIDLKTCADCRPFPFRQSVHNYEYFIQAAVYKYLLENKYKKEFKTFIWLCVENKAPFVFSYYYVSEKLLELGLNIMKDTLPRMIQSIRSQDYKPKLNEAGEILELSEWQLYNYRTQGLID